MRTIQASNILYKNVELLTLVCVLKNIQIDCIYILNPHVFHKEYIKNQYAPFV